MQKILKIARREYVEMVKTKTFLIGILFAPAITIGIIFFANKISKSEGGPRPPVRIAVSDLSNQLSSAMAKEFNKHNDSNPASRILYQSLDDKDDPISIEEQGKVMLRSGKLDAYIVLDKDILESSGKAHFYTHKPKPSSLDVFWVVEEIINSVVVDQRCKFRNISSQLLSEIRTVAIERVEIGDRAEKQRLQSKAETMTRMMIPFFFMFLIYMGIVGIGQQMLSSVIEEKNSRIIEVLLSVVSPFELMGGKILGLAGIGLTVVGLWATAAFGAGRWQGLNIDITAGLLLYFILYHILGFVLFSSILAGVGSICNTLKETQGLMMPIVLIFIIPLISWYKLVQSPDGTLARVLSFVPPVTPLVMILRISASSNVGPFEIVASIVLLAVTVFVMIWLAAKVFRTGILMYGKRPRLREVFRWLVQS